MNITAYDIAQRFVGVKELPGEKNNPFIMAMLTLDQSWPGNDEVAWCGAFCNYIAWLLRLPRSKSLAARSWLTVGVPVLSLEDAELGFDVVVLSRGINQPGDEVLDAPGHVGFFAGFDGAKKKILILGGNQGNSVNVSAFDVSRLLGIRRISLTASQIS